MDRSDLRRHLGVPLYRNAYALMANSAATSVLGLGYWILAARLYSARDVGLAAATVEMMRVLAGIVAINFAGALTTWIPQAGRLTGTLVRQVYLVAMGGTVLASVAFLLTLDRWAPDLGYLRATPAMAALFCLAVTGWCVFFLQDEVLTGLRRAIWVPIENGGFAVLKLVLLVVLAGWLPGLGIFASWAVPVAASALLVNLLIFARLLPEHERLATHTPERLPYRRIGVFLAGDSVGTISNQVVQAFVPLLVIGRFGPEINAYVFMAWMLTSSLQILAINMASSLTVEGSMDAARIPAHLASAARVMATLLVPVVAALVLLAEPVLAVFGPAYADVGAGVLRLFALALIPRAVITLYTGVMRAMARPVRLATARTAANALFIGLALVSVGPLGVDGVGVAALVAYSAGATLVLPDLRRCLAAGRAAPVPARQPGVAP